MYATLVKVSLISAWLLCCHAASIYEKAGTPSYEESPKFSLFNIERGDVEERADREILIFEVPRQNQAPNARPHLVSLENVVGSTAAAQSSAYVPPAYPVSPYSSSAASPWNYQKPYYVTPKQERPYYVAIEDVLPPQKHHTRHFSLFDVNLPAPPQIIINSYPKERLLPSPVPAAMVPPIDVRSSDAAPSIDTRSSYPAPSVTVQSAGAPSIDVRSSKATQKVHDVETESTNRNTEIKVTTDKPVDDPNRASRSAEEDDSVIIFPRSTDGEDGSTEVADDSVELLAPLDRLKRNVVSLENVVGPGQVGYPVYRYPQQPVVVQPYRYPQQSVVYQTYPQRPVVVQTYPQQYAVCPYGNCNYRG